MPDTALVMEQLQKIHGDITDMRVHWEKRLSTLEAHDDDMQDNGQPGWKSKIEKRLTTLETRVAMFVGGGVVGGTLIHFAIDVMLKH